MKTTLMVAAVALGTSLLTTPLSAEEPVEIKAVGTWGNLTNFQKHEGPFWNDHIGQITDGKITGEIKSQTELGLKGFEIMRMIKLGVFDYAYGLPGYVAAETPALEGLDLSALTQDIATQRKVSDAYFPVLEKEFASVYNAKLLQLYPFPSQTLWCRDEIKSIADLKDKKIRVYSATLGDFVEGVGGTSVTVPFAEVIPALEKGVVDCGITGTMSAYKAKWNQVANYAYVLRVGWGMAFGAMNMDTWNKLGADNQATLAKELSTMTDAMWDETASEDEIAISCITGGKCDIGEAGSMVLVEPSEADLIQQVEIMNSVVLPRWAERCGEECIDNWKETVGPVVGLQ
ncbi:TRAP transporter substrate-binding protein [Kiloniella laminariae]|uniref:TRAP transporter substrate-binding protein n=1 Tax=Kiloniella laminariae TaxID=454162 RepID=A0ABT4LQJ4_9PROT|nr:TRAP transporter substrate-binding protein [Kiloniella laminariae]MCZ4282586.1 TRAP transporter substrate-binding protein [Kiloniella laminariae]